jgi:hypothetical protein
MRHLITAAAFVICLVGIARSEEPTAEMKESVTFDGRTLVLAFEGSNPDSTIKEFVSKGETLESWTHLAGIFEYPDLHDPLALVREVDKLLKEKNPLARSAILENEKTGDVIIDFITWPEDGSFVEFNVFKYHKTGNDGVTAWQYAVREYKDQIPFLEELRPLRERLVAEMAETGLVVTPGKDNDKP